MCCQLKLETFDRFKIPIAIHIHRNRGHGLPCGKGYLAACPLDIRVARGVPVHDHCILDKYRSFQPGAMKVSTCTASSASTPLYANARKTNVPVVCPATKVIVFGSMLGNSAPTSAVTEIAQSLNETADGTGLDRVAVQVLNWSRLLGPSTTPPPITFSLGAVPEASSSSIVAMPPANRLLADLHLLG